MAIRLQCIVICDGCGKRAPAEMPLSFVYAAAGEFGGGSYAVHNGASVDLPAGWEQMPIQGSLRCDTCREENK